MSGRPALFLDRDGVINIDTGYVHRPEQCEFIPGIFRLVTMARQRGYAVLVVTNQAGIGRGYYTEADFHAFTRWQLEQFEQHGTRIDRVYFCPHHPIHGIGSYHTECECRKPGTGMFRQAQAELGIDMAASLMVGDKLIDMEAAQGAGVPRRFLYWTAPGPAPASPGLDFTVVGALDQIADALKP